MGYVYLLTNRAMPGVVKIGSSARNPIERADELYTTGVPTPFRVYRVWSVGDHADLERQLHRELRDHRLSVSREFFRLGASKAAALIDSLIGSGDTPELKGMGGEQCAMAGCKLQPTILFLGRGFCLRCASRARRALRGVSSETRRQYVSKNLKPLKPF